MWFFVCVCDYVRVHYRTQSRLRISRDETRVGHFRYWARGISVLPKVKFCTEYKIPNTKYRFEDSTEIQNTKSWKKNPEYRIPQDFCRPCPPLDETHDRHRVVNSLNWRKRTKRTLTDPFFLRVFDWQVFIDIWKSFKIHHWRTLSTNDFESAKIIWQTAKLCGRLDGMVH